MFVDTTGGMALMFVPTLEAFQEDGDKKEARRDRRAVSFTARLRLLSEQHLPQLGGAGVVNQVQRNARSDFLLYLLRRHVGRNPQTVKQHLLIAFQRRIAQVWIEPAARRGIVDILAAVHRFFR